MISLAEIRADDMIDEGIIGRSPAIRDVFDPVRMVAPTDSTVLICGETGTGKELVARAVHRLSGRHARTFVKCNCAALQTSLLESELFGHERGAFTSAAALRIGRFELANHGTIFLDEIGEALFDAQPKLLRVLQEHEFERLGSSHTLRTDVPVIAATNEDLPQMVAAKRFRADLYYRLNVFPIQVPPLRDRREDIPMLVRLSGQTIHRCPISSIDGGRHVDFAIGTSQAWREVIRQATQVAPTEATTCLQGESGTGKEVIARFIHQWSPRRAVAGSQRCRPRGSKIVRFLRTCERQGIVLRNCPPYIRE
jgi:transcriptional regulator with GAF, ATPase, and Fis domain